MKHLLKFILPTVLVSGVALAQFDPNLVGGGDSLGSGVSSPFADLGYASTADYTAAKAQGYGPSKGDATLWGHAQQSTSGNSQQISGSSQNYGNVYTNLGNQNGASVSKTTFQPVFDCTAAVGSPGYDNYADCTNAVSKQYALVDYTLYNQAKTASSALQLYCGAVCTTVNKSVFETAQSNQSAFDIDKANGSDGTTAGTLTAADLTAHNVTLNATWNSGSRKNWLIAYANQPSENTSSPMNAANHPTTGAGNWQDKLNAYSLADVSWWYLQQVLAGTITTPGLSTDLFASAGLGASYSTQEVVTQVTTASSSINSSNYASKSAFQSYITTLLTPTWDATPGTAIAKNLATAASGSSIVTSSASVSGGTVSYQITGADNSSFAISSGGAVTTASNLAAGTYNFNVVATPNVGTAITKAFSVDVNTVPTLASFACGSGFVSTAYSCTTPSATDADGDALTYSLVGAPSWLSINASTGALSGTPSATGTASGIKVSVSDGSDTSMSAAFSVVINANPGSALASTSTAATSSQVGDWATFGVNSAITTDLTTNNTCGASGNQSCLAAFNAQKASSSCTLPGSSATAAQLETYIACVMIEHHTAVANAVTVPSSNTATGNSCTVAVNGPVPSTCAHPQWTCTIQGTPSPSGWSVTQSSGLAYASVDLTSQNGAPVNASYTVRASLGIYSPAYTKDYTYNVTVPASSGAGSTSLSEYSGGKEMAGFWNHCLNQNGVLATEAEVLAHKGWSSLPTGLYLNGNYNPYGGFVVNANGSDEYASKNCGSSYSSVAFIKSISSGSWASWANASMRNHGSGTRLKYRDSDGNIQTGNCRTVSYRTSTFFCKQQSYSCN